MNELSRLGIDTPIATELYIPKYDSVSLVEFDGTKLAIDGLVQHQFIGDDHLMPRLVLHRTMSRPDAPVSRDELRNDGTIPRPETVRQAVNQAESYFLRTGVNPLRRIMRPRTHKAAAHVIEYITFETGVQHDTQKDPDVTQISQSIRPNIALMPLHTRKEVNDLWILALLEENSDLRTVKFDRMTEQDITLCRLLHKGTGAELGIAQLRDLYNDGLEMPLDMDDFLEILTAWAMTYSNVDALKRRIHMRKAVLDGRPDALFRWQRPTYQGY